MLGVSIGMVGLGDKEGKKRKKRRK